MKQAMVHTVAKIQANRNSCCSVQGFTTIFS
ncbi:hypothetical protein T11_17286 [Trichinella zimbabwensis]|uniref:Uncharacterized protein n=1 Tax=Trichinella zimbabwensis TaxID=268475 RepID=A0A0V1G8X9_9BILA|nr:hypothetical protein T11_17286 [Trichinella zimbabwensis]